MAAPVDSARQGTNITTAATSHAINVGSPVAGTLLIVFVRFAAAPGTITFTGYTSLNGAAGDSSDAADDTTIVFYRWADGSEGATDTLTTANSVKLAAISWEVTGAQDPSVSPPNISTVATGTTAANSANPGSVAPASPPRDTLYLALAGGDGEVGAYTAFPTNYANLVTANSGTGGNANTNVFIGGASRGLTNSSSEDPGAFTHGAHVTGWTAYAVAVRLPVAGTPHTTDPADTLDLTDASAITQGKAVADTLALEDTSTFGQGKAVADTQTLSDELTRVHEAARVMDDSLTLTDSTAMQRGSALADSLSLSDFITATSAKTVQIDDALVLADARAFGYAWVLADPLTLTDEATPDLVAGSQSSYSTIDPSRIGEWA